jgi:hypothetical protein
MAGGTKGNGRPIKYHTKYHERKRRNTRDHRNRTRQQYERELEAARQQRALNTRTAKIRWALYDVIDVATGNIIDATVRLVIEQPGPRFVRSRWMPRGVHDYTAAKAIVALRRLQIEEWRANAIDYVI